MGCIFSRCNEPNVKIHDCIPPRYEFDYLRSQRTVTLSLDRKYNIPIVDIRFGGWYEKSDRIWPKHTKQREHFLLLERTPLQTSSISSIGSSDKDKGFHTVF